MKQRDQLKSLLKGISETQLNLSSETARDYLVDKIMEVVNGDLKDNCVLCGESTPYQKSTHIDFRDYYVEGSGQLCKTCYTNIYNKDEHVSTI